MTRALDALSFTLASLIVACESTPAATPTNRSDAAAPANGEIALSIVRLRAGSDPATLTVSVPFAPGELTDPAAVQLFDGANEVARNTSVLARWNDGSLRALLVGFTTPSVVGTRSTLTLKSRGANAKSLPGTPEATRCPTLRAFATGDRWSTTGSLGISFQRADTGSFAPSFFRRAAPVFQSVANPPAGSNTTPRVRNYYDHTHALYSHMLALEPTPDLVERIDAEVTRYREAEIVHSGRARGTYSAPPDTESTTPIDFNIVRRMYAQGLVEDYLVSGDQRSLEVAKEIADAFLADVPAQTPYYAYTERIPAWTLLGLLPVYEVTGDVRYLNAAKSVGDVALAHQEAMATKYPNQAGVTGLTGAFAQDRRGAWFDDSESTASGAGSPFMTTLLVEALVRLYRDTNDVRYLESATKAVRWLGLGCFVDANDGATVFTDDPDPSSGDDASLHHASFRYVCRASDNRTALPALNPMFALALGVGWQRTGDELYRTMARAVLGFDGWGYTIKEYNQSMRSASQGFLLLERPAGSLLPKR
jgi:hypothetical protein